MGHMFLYNELPKEEGGREGGAEGRREGGQTRKTEELETNLGYRVSLWPA